MPLGATGERTDLNRGESHAPIRSRSTVSVGGRDTTLAGQPSGDIAKMSQPPPVESATPTGHRHASKPDIEFRKTIRRGADLRIAAWLNTRRWRSCLARI